MSLNCTAFTEIPEDMMLRSTYQLEHSTASPANALMHLSRLFCYCILSVLHFFNMQKVKFVFTSVFGSLDTQLSEMIPTNTCSR